MKILSGTISASCGHKKEFPHDMSLSLGQINNYINNIENKKSLPAMQSFFYICEYLGVTPQEFFDEGNTYPETLKEFIAEADSLILNPCNISSVL